MVRHGVYVSERDTAGIAIRTTQTGIPFVIGAFPVQNAQNPAQAGVPALLTSFSDARQRVGYSDDWANYPACETIYAHFVTGGLAPVIAVNLLDIATMKTSVAAADKTVTNKAVDLGTNAIPASIVVKPEGGTGSAYVKGTDYNVYVNDNGSVIVTTIKGGSAYSATKLNIAYDNATPASVTPAIVAAGMETIDLCMMAVSTVPDLIVAPGYSHKTAVSDAMIAKARAINGMFKAKAIIDISTDPDEADGGANVYDDVAAVKASRGLTDRAAVPCWPMAKFGDRIFHMSTLVALGIQNVDAENEVPYASPSNRAAAISALCDEDGAEITMSLAQANLLSDGGVMTALNFMGTFVLWGNYTGAQPASTDIKDVELPISRMFEYVNNVCIKTLWSKLDRPLTRVLIDSTLDTLNIWLNGLTGAGYIYGGRVVMDPAENPESDLIQGKVKLHIYMTPPAALKEIDVTIEYDATYISALTA